MQIQTDGVHVWVNDHDGHCIGRFAPQSIDVHAGLDAQLRGEHCLFCITNPAQFKKPLRFGDWFIFCVAMANFHGVDVPITTIQRFDEDTTPTCYFVITHKTADYGEKYVLREFTVGPEAGRQGVAREPTCVADTLDLARKEVRPGMQRVPRCEHDDTVIVEMWF